MLRSIFLLFMALFFSGCVPFVPFVKKEPVPAAPIGICAVFNIADSDGMQ